MEQNIYQRLGLKRVINACGKMTILGVSSVASEVMQATTEAASAFVEIDKLVDRAGNLSPATPAVKTAILPPALLPGSPLPWPPPSRAAGRSRSR